MGITLQNISNGVGAKGKWKQFEVRPLANKPTNGNPVNSSTHK